MNRGVLGAIYWKLHSSFLRNERKQAQAFLGMFLDEAKSINAERELGPIHHDRLLKMKAAIEQGHFGRIFGQGDPTPEPPGTMQADSGAREAEFHQWLIKPAGRAHLFRVLNITQPANMLHEVEMDPYGRCDFVVREGRTWHVVEVKVGGEAKSGVVSQIDKYRLASELDMVLGMHDAVIPTVIAEGFSPYVSGELSRLSVQMVLHSGTPESLRNV